MAHKIGRMAHDCRRDELPWSTKFFFAGDVIQCSCGEYFEVTQSSPETKYKSITKGQFGRMVASGAISLNSK